MEIQLSGNTPFLGRNKFIACSVNWLASRFHEHHPLTYATKQALNLLICQIVILNFKTYISSVFFIILLSRQYLHIHYVLFWRQGASKIGIIGAVGVVGQIKIYGDAAFSVLA